MCFVATDRRYTAVITYNLLIYIHINLLNVHRLKLIQYIRLHDAVVSRNRTFLFHLIRDSLKVKQIAPRLPITPCNFEHNALQHH